jgi:sigma-B regulation protein RsbU (phosphoserine phosphatase)
MAAQRLQKGELPAGSMRQTAITILRSSKHMAHMVERLLEFTEARFGSGLPVERAPTDLADVARTVVTETQLAYPDSALHFEVEGNTCGSWDAIRLGEVTSNLIGNAIKHGTCGETIDVAVVGNGSDVQLRVHNAGPPIPEETLPLIYEPFVGAGKTTGKRGLESSLGLGLYITRELVHAHGGSIEVSSSPDAGTTFTVHLPR